MNDQGFSLEPFPQASPPPSFKITGNIARRSNTLFIRYALPGHLAELVIPAPVGMPARKKGLWEGTCFEFFLALRNSHQYWEFNLSPAGHWNVYRFSDYRQGMEEEMAFTSLPFHVEHQSDSLRLALELDLNPIVQADQSLEVAISAVIKIRDGDVTYWALTHRGSRADFHRRNSFIVEL
ncbi:DOMON-like domain-containing protein [Nitrospinota bacterium]